MADKVWVGTTGDLGTAGNWSPSGVPAAGDNVYIPAGSGSITGSSALSTASLSGALGTVEVEAGYTGTIGSRTSYMVLSAGTFRFAGKGTSYVNLEASAISPDIRATATPTSSDGVGLYLKGSALATLSAVGDCAIGLAYFGGETSTVTTARVVGPSARLTIGAGVTATTIQVLSGTGTVKAGCTTLDVQGGMVTTLGSGAITTVTVDAGTANLNSSGTITTLTQTGGSVDMLGNGAARTVTTMNHNGGLLRYDKDVVTITTYNRKSGPSQIVVSDP